MNDLQKDLYLLAAALMQLMMMVFLAVVSPKLAESGGESEFPLPRQVVASIQLPQIVKRADANHLLSVKQLDLRVEINGTPAQPALTTNVDLSRALVEIPLVEGDIKALLRIRTRPIGASLRYSVSPDDRLVNVELACEFVDRPQAYPLQVAIYARVETDPSGLGLEEPIRGWWRQLALAFDRGELDSRGIEVHYEHHAEAAATSLPEGSSIVAGFPSVIVQGNTVRLHLTHGDWMTAATTAAMQRIAASLSLPAPVQRAHGYEFQLPGGPALSGPLHLDFVYKLNVAQSATGGDDDNAFATPQLDCQFQPTANTPLGH